MARGRVVGPRVGVLSGRVRRALEMNGRKRLVQRVERKLEAAAGDVFARVFGGSIVPQELETVLQREAAAGVRPLRGNRPLAGLWHRTNTSLLSVGTTTRRRVPTRISRRLFLLNTWRDISGDRDGKRMVRWSSDLTGRRTCIPASSAPVVLSTPMPAPTRQPEISPRHNLIRRLTQNQEYHQ